METPKVRPSGQHGYAKLDESFTRRRRLTREKSSLEVTEEHVPRRINEEDWVKYTMSPVGLQASPGLGLAKTSLLFPVGPLKFSWDLFMLVLIVYSAVTVPFRLAMDHPAEGPWWCLEVAVSLCFIVDIILTFWTSYLEGDQFVLDRGMIRSNYFKGWLLLDVASSIPLELIDALVATLSGGDGTGQTGQLRMLRALRLVRLLRLLRLLKIQQYINIIEDALNINMTFVSLIKLILGIAYLTHVLGCAWYWIGSTSTADTTWLQVYDDASGLESSVWVRYLYSVYWAFTTLSTVGYGDIVPTNNSERGLALLTFLSGVLIFGHMISSIADMVANADPNAVKIEEKLDEVKVYLRWHKFKPDLALRVRRYYEFYFSRKSAMDEEEIVRNLAPALRRAVQEHLVHRTVARIPIFHPERSYVHIDMQLQVLQMLTCTYACNTRVCRSCRCSPRS